MDNLVDFKMFLKDNFSDAVNCLRLYPIVSVHEHDREGYGFVVTFRREMTDAETQKFPLHFNGVPVASHLAGGMKDREP